MSLPRELRIYQNFTGDELDPSDPKRLLAILEEMIAVRDAPTLEAAMAVIEWWDWPQGSDARRELTRELQKRLRRKRTNAT